MPGMEHGRDRMPAEWEPHRACLMAWPTRRELWGDVFDEAIAEYAAVADAIGAFEPVVMVAAPGRARAGPPHRGQAVDRHHQHAVHRAGPARGDRHRASATAATSAGSRARAKDGDAIELLIPDGPTEAFVDVWAIPANAPHRSPRTRRSITCSTRATPPDRPSTSSSAARSRGAEDPDTAIPDDALARFEIPSVLSPEGERKRARIFTEFKAA